MFVNKGFSLVELLAVMVILGVLALITVPAVLNIVNELEAIKSGDRQLSSLSPEMLEALKQEGISSQQIQQIL